MWSFKSNNRGISIVEVLVVVVLIGILAATVPPAILGYVAEKREELHVADFWMEMNSIRGKVLKGGAPVIVTFDYNTNEYAVFIDSNHNSTADSAEIQTNATSKKLVFGTPTPTISTFPPGVSDKTLVSASWKSGILFDDNSTLSIPAGHLYLQNTARPEQGYCLTVSSGESEVNLYKWDGSKWYEF